jgi:hypothetical protein
MRRASLVVDEIGPPADGGQHRQVPEFRLPRVLAAPEIGSLRASTGTGAGSGQCRSLGIVAILCK